MCFQVQVEHFSNHDLSSVSIPFPSLKSHSINNFVIFIEFYTIAFVITITFTLLRSIYFQDRINYKYVAMESEYIKLSQQTLLSICHQFLSFQISSYRTASSFIRKIKCKKKLHRHHKLVHPVICQSFVTLNHGFWYYFKNDIVTDLFCMWTLLWWYFSFCHTW